MDVNLDERNQPIIECLASVARIDILRLLSHGPLSTTEVAAQLRLTKGIVSRHMTMLEECGFISHVQKKGVHGVRKEYSLREKSVTIRFTSTETPREQRILKNVRIGEYEECAPIAPCGLSRRNVLLGLKNDPRFFFMPDRTGADDIWMARGRVTYLLPFTADAIRSAAGLRITFTAFCDGYASQAGEDNLLAALGTRRGVAIPLSRRDLAQEASPVGDEYRRTLEWRGDTVLLDGHALCEMRLADTDKPTLTFTIESNDSRAIVHFMDGIECELIF